MPLTEEKIRQFKEINHKYGQLLDLTDDQIKEIATGVANFFDISGLIANKKINRLEQCECEHCTIHDKL